MNDRCNNGLKDVIAEMDEKLYGAKRENNYMKGQRRELKKRLAAKDTEIAQLKAMVEQLKTALEQAGGYDFIAGAAIKQDDFVYISKNGKIYPYRKLLHQTREEEVIVDGEPTYPKDLSGLKLYYYEMQQATQKKSQNCKDSCPDCGYPNNGHKQATPKI